MKHLLITSLLKSVASLPAPVNLRIESLNFKHVLHWDPGPGSPPGTQFWIYKNRKVSQKPVNSTSCNLKLKPEKKHELAVEASYNNTKSPRSTITFQPLTETENTEKKRVDLYLNYFQELETHRRIFNLSNLEKDVEYCVRVLPKARSNKNTQPSEWKCIFTSISEPDYGDLTEFLEMPAALMVRQ
uniref:Fibronectin type-III domain-containing protein n=1 Tax=Poecilia reticulata TaxID=8081 RepID=A0A3P9Q1Y8_POERE